MPAAKCVLKVIRTVLPSSSSSVPPWTVDNSEQRLCCDIGMDLVVTVSGLSSTFA